MSSRSDVPMSADTVVFGEISLSGEVRPVNHADQRVKEAAKLGFARAMTPPWPKRRDAPLEIDEISRLHELTDLFTSRSSQST